jgi:hypothetical protein
MPYPYVTSLQVRKHLGAHADRVLDDAINEIILDGSAQVAGALRGNYKLDEVALSTPREVVRLTLLAVRVICLQRYPEVFRQDWGPMSMLLEKQLDGVSTGKRRLDVVDSPEPAKNTGAYVGDQLNETTVERWGGRMGDF